MEVLKPQFQGGTVIMPFTKKVYTIADIEALPEGKRAELINGKMYMLASPYTVHQELLGALYVNIFNFITKNKGKCKVFPAPFSVYLHNDDKTYLEPDISVICDLNKVDKRGCHGAPDWVIEIVSPSTGKRDYGIKQEEYRKAGVREYWIVNPEKRKVTVQYLQTEEVVVEYSFADKIPVGIYEDFAIDFAEFSGNLTYE